ncbi:glycosyl hydrolase 115 family protein [Pedobacter cryotolerans]|uniref:Glycosyl hydrolase n=1 Tax=Pedobacter cryotolerans TaxID=2571270 RepID=A0A4U1BVZ4_9SPHI|nr:glycosyl hydrolase 115 family protein [Pedobacter cryotolerans]TKB96594.1 glycosyl hydrolase [Pedobacter cryotolerans]
MKKTLLILLIIISSFGLKAAALDPITVNTYMPGSFSLVKKGKVSPILVSENEWPGAIRAAKNLQSDIEKVTGIGPEFFTDKPQSMPIIIGTIGKSKLIDEMISNRRINVGGIAGKWESTLIQVVKNPVIGVDSALVIVGSDKRGTIYGIYELSSQIGVSPWYYWADVPAKKSNSIFVIAGEHVISSPAVKYRGIFLNDEAPALSGWSKKEFGGFNSKFYEKVFELILRLKGNYLWPAMWGNAFNDDDKLNPILADEFGVVIGTSHHEPLSRAHDEWRRYKGGKWNYEQNPNQLKEFWETGFKRIADKEQIITIGMRGDGDEPMSTGTATALLEKIVKDQREIIENITKKPASETPQLWALYKEVQDYYDKGMRVPDDVTLLLCDDNWGNIRKLPKLGENPRKGGYGIYYHFDYVGGPRNYKWVNTNPIQKIWEQMRLAYEHDANQIWIVNVGDLKPMEFPIQFFLDYAWAPDAIPSEKLMDYTKKWASKQFGADYAITIASFIDTYLKYAGRIKPELLNASTYSLINYNEFDQVTTDFIQLKNQANAIYLQLDADKKDAYYQLVLHPIEALSNLYEMYLAVARNKLYAKQGRLSANYYADKVDSLFKRDAAITTYYNKTMAGGKWDHMMDQTHIGYTSWQQPEENIIPKTTKIPNENTALGLMLEGNETHLTGKFKSNITLPGFSSLTQKSHYFELYRTGNAKISYQIKAPNFVILSQNNGELTDDQRIEVSIDWKKAPKGSKASEIVVRGSDGNTISFSISTINAVNNDLLPNLFVPENGYISIEAPSFNRAVNSRPIFWKTIPNYGKTKGGVTATPVSSPIQNPSDGSPHLEYDIYLSEVGNFTLQAFISPTIDFTGTDGLKFAISIDDQKPVTVNISSNYTNEGAWGQSVANGIKIFKTPFSFDKAGKHTIKYWMINPGVVLQKLVLDMGGLKPSFLGPPESTISIKNKH